MCPNVGKRAGQLGFSVLAAHQYLVEYSDGSRVPVSWRSPSLRLRPTFHPRELLLRCRVSTAAQSRLPYGYSTHQTGANLVV